MRRKVVVVGGGPGGLEAARVAASRGHRVVLFEAASDLGGQIVLAAKATWRGELIGIAHWLGTEVARLGVDVRLNRLAEADDVLAEDADVVIVATGGLPNVGHFEGRELAVTAWDVLAGQVACGGEVLVVDESGDHTALSCAGFMAAKGARVEIVTPDRVLGAEMAETNLGAHMDELYKLGVEMRPDTRLVSLERDGNRLEAMLANTYRDDREPRLVDQVVGDYGTLPNDALYRALKPLSRNLGEADLRAMAEAAPQWIETNARGRFMLWRIGDAWASRNIHAAMLDAMRLCVSL